MFGLLWVFLSGHSRRRKLKQDKIYETKRIWFQPSNYRKKYAFTKVITQCYITAIKQQQSSSQRKKNVCTEK